MESGYDSDVVDLDVLARAEAGIAESEAEEPDAGEEGEELDAPDEPDEPDEPVSPAPSEPDEPKPGAPAAVEGDDDVTSRPAPASSPTRERRHGQVKKRRRS